MDIALAPTNLAPTCPLSAAQQAQVNAALAGIPAADLASVLAAGNDGGGLSINNVNVNAASVLATSIGLENGGPLTFGPGVVAQSDGNGGIGFGGATLTGVGGIALNNGEISGVGTLGLSYLNVTNGGAVNLNGASISGTGPASFGATTTASLDVSGGAIRGMSELSFGQLLYNNNTHLALFRATESDTTHDYGFGITAGSINVLVAGTPAAHFADGGIVLVPPVTTSSSLSVGNGATVLGADGSAGFGGPETITLNNTDPSASGRNHLTLVNGASGQTIVETIINGSVASRWRTDHQSNVNWVAGVGGQHYFYTGGDYYVGSAKVQITTAGRVLMGPTLPADDGATALQVAGTLKATGATFSGNVSAGSGVFTNSISVSPTTYGNTYAFSLWGDPSHDKGVWWDANPHVVGYSNVDLRANQFGVGIQIGNGNSTIAVTGPTTFTSPSASSVVTTLTGATSQTGDFLRCNTSNGVSQFSVSASGQITANGLANFNAGAILGGVYTNTVSTRFVGGSLALYSSYGPVILGDSATSLSGQVIDVALPTNFRAGATFAGHVSALGYSANGSSGLTGVYSFASYSSMTVVGGIVTNVN